MYSTMSTPLWITTLTHPSPIGFAVHHSCCLASSKGLSPAPSLNMLSVSPTCFLMLISLFRKRDVIAEFSINP